MQRAQFLIEPWQSDALRSLAERRGVSVSAVVRDILTAQLENPSDRVRHRLDGIAGVAEGPPDLGSDHDAYLYGKRETGQKKAAPAKKPPRRKKKG